MANPTGQSGVAVLALVSFSVRCLSRGVPKSRWLCHTHLLVEVHLVLRSWQRNSNLCRRFSGWPHPHWGPSTQIADISNSLHVVKCRGCLLLYNCARSSRVHFEQWRVVGRYRMSRILHPASSFTNHGLTVTAQLFFVHVVEISIWLTLIWQTS